MRSYAQPFVAVLRAAMLPLAVALFVTSMACSSDLVSDAPATNDTGSAGTDGDGSFGTGSNNAPDSAPVRSAYEGYELANVPTAREAPVLSLLALDENNQRVRQLLVSIDDRFNHGMYDAGLDLVARAEERTPIDAGLDLDIAAEKARLLVFRAAFADIERLTTDENLWRLTYVVGGYVDGYILEESTRDQTLLLKRTGALKGFERIHVSEIARRDRITAGEQSAVQDDEYVELVIGFESREAHATAVDYFKMAQVAWRYNRQDEAHEFLLQAFAIDPNVGETVKLERDPQFLEFIEASSRGDLVTARGLLHRLVARYPDAELFKSVELQLRLDTGVSEVRRGNLVEAVLDTVEDEAKADAADTRRDIEVATEGQFAQELEGTADELVRRGDAYYEAGLAEDRLSLPGMDGFEAHLELAMANYRFAQELYNKALRRGGSADVEEKLTNVQRALFWCRKRKPIG